jgi:hypothetical protein
MQLKQWRWVTLGPAVVLVAGLTSALAPASPAASAATSGAALNCASAAHSANCVDVFDPEAVGGEGRYVGHDEPATIFYSNRAGSGNNDNYLLRLPKDPPVPPNQAGTAGTDNFQLHITFWVGMAMCDTQSFPEATPNCAPDSNSNIFNSPDPASPRYIGHHPGTAFMEMQFYPPGWAPWPAGVSCDARQWCAALTIDSYNSNPAGVDNNTACLNSVGVEPVNFAFITKNGRAQAPANPVDATAATYTPDPAKDLFMNSGDSIAVSMHDTAAGFQVRLADLTTRHTGSMTASAANTFGQVLYQPTSPVCNVAPYSFHPMYSTSTTQTRVPWAAHSYNIAFSDEIGHFEYCNAVDPSTGSCTSAGGGDSAADSDDVGCFTAAQSLLVPVSGCIGSDGDFDGPSYLNVWPGTGSPRHDAKFDPQPIAFTSPVFNGSQRYSQMGFEADMPRIERPDFGGICNGATGAGCVNPPPGSQFYPIYSTTDHGPLPVRGCSWQEGGPAIPGTTSNFGGSSATEYSQNLLRLVYPSVNSAGQPAPQFIYEDFRNIIANPC